MYRILCLYCVCLLLGDFHAKLISDQKTNFLFITCHDLCVLTWFSMVLCLILYVIGYIPAVGQDRNIWES